MISRSVSGVTCPAHALYCRRTSISTLVKCASVFGKTVKCWCEHQLSTNENVRLYVLPVPSSQCAPQNHSTLLDLQVSYSMRCTFCGKGLHPIVCSQQFLVFVSVNPVASFPLVLVSDRGDSNGLNGPIGKDPPMLLRGFGRLWG